MKNKKFQYVIYRAKVLIKRGKYSLKSGFLLIEIMVCLMAFAGVAVLVARYQVAALRQNKQALNYLKAIDIAWQAIEHGEAVQAKNGQFKVERTIDDYVVPQQLKEADIAISRLKNMKTIEVKMSWIYGNGQTKSIRIGSVIAQPKEAL